MVVLLISYKRDNGLCLRYKRDKNEHQRVKSHKRSDFAFSILLLLVNV